MPEEIAPSSLESSAVWRVAKIVYWVTIILIAWPFANVLVNWTQEVSFSVGGNYAGLDWLAWVAAPLILVIAYPIYKFGFKTLFSYFIFGKTPGKTKEVPRISISYVIIALVALIFVIAFLVFVGLVVLSLFTGHN